MMLMCTQWVLPTYADDKLCWREGDEGHLNEDGNYDWIKRKNCHKDVNSRVGDALDGDGDNFDFDDDGKSDDANANDN